MDTPQGDPQGQPSVEPQSDPGVADTGQPQNNEQPAADFPNLRNEDGSLNEEKMLGTYKELQKMSGDQANELGQLRTANDQWAVYRTGEQERIDAAVANAAPTPAPSGGADYEALLDERWDTDKVGFVKELLVAAEDGALKRMTEQQTAFSDPMLDKHPDIKMVAQGLMAESGYSAADAIDLALGRKARGVVAGGGDSINPSPAVPPTSSGYDRSSFIAATGTPSDRAPSTTTELSVAEKQMADKQGMTYEEYAKWKR